MTYSDDPIERPSRAELYKQALGQQSALMKENRILRDQLLEALVVITELEDELANAHQEIFSLDEELSAYEDEEDERRHV